MRRTLFLTLGILELFVAAALVGLGRQLPDREQVEGSFSKAERVTRRAGNQVQQLQRHIDGLRRPELQQLAGRLQTQLRTVTATLREQAIDFGTVSTLRDALAVSAGGLRNLSDTLDPSGIGKLGDGLGQTASFLDEKLIPAAESAAKRLDESTEQMRVDARRLADFLRNVPIDLKAVGEVHDGLGTFSQGLTALNATLNLKRLDTVRDGFRGMEDALSTGAEQVERLSNYTYPVLTFNGLKPEIDRRQFWPEGERIATGLRKAGTGVTAAGKEMDEVVKNLPELRASLEASRKILDSTREALGLALKQRAAIEPLLKEVPEHAAQIAESLPQLGKGLSNVLRDTRRFREAAAALRRAQEGVDMTIQRWPELRKAMLASADLLQAARQQLDRALQHQQDYERAVHQTAALGEAFASLLPVLSEQMDNQLGEEEQSLDELGQSIEEVSSVLPEYGKTAGGVAATGRLLAWLVAAIVLLHGGYLILSAGVGRPL